MSIAQQSDQAFKKANLTEVDHQAKCQYRSRSIPINECPCDCYERAIFLKGYREGWFDKQEEKQ